MDREAEFFVRLDSKYTKEISVKKLKYLMFKHSDVYNVDL